MTYNVYIMKTTVSPPHTTVVLVAGPLPREQAEIQARNRYRRRMSKDVYYSLIEFIPEVSPNGSSS